MFGGRSFIVNDAMIASALRSGDLLVRVSSEQDGDLIEMAGAARAEMGAGRTMGLGWISVSAASITSEERLSFWVRAALEHNHGDRKAKR